MRAEVIEDRMANIIMYFLNSDIAGYGKPASQSGKRHNRQLSRPGDHLQAFTFGFSLPDSQPLPACRIRITEPLFLIFLSHLACRIQGIFSCISNDILASGRLPKKPGGNGVLDRFFCNLCCSPAYSLQRP